MAGYLQVNGVTYESPDVTDATSAAVIVDTLLGGVPGLGAVIRVSVIPKEGGASTDLAVRTSSVWSAAAWHEG